MPRVPAPSRKRTRAVEREPAERARRRRARARGAGAPAGLRRASARGKLLDSPVRETREVAHGPLERGERGAAGLVRDRNGDLGARGERLEQRPLRAGQILEAVGKDGLACPDARDRREAARPLGAEGRRDPGARAGELDAIGARESTEIAIERVGVEQARTRARRCVASSASANPPVEAEAPRRSRCAPAMARRAASVRCTSDATGRAPGVFAGDALEEVVERPDRPGEERGPPADQVTLDPLDVGASWGRRATDRARALSRKRSRSSATLPA